MRDLNKVYKLSKTIWQVNRRMLIDSIERQTKRPLPADCLPLMEFCFIRGCMAMEQTVGKNWRAGA